MYRGWTTELCYEGMPSKTGTAVLEDDSQELLLLERLRSQDPEASKQFVRAHIGWMRQLAERVVRDRSLAEDCVQEAFSSAFFKLDRFEGRSKLKTWLHRIVVNAALMKVRQGKQRREDQSIPFDEQASLEGAHALGTPAPHPEDALMRADVQTAVRSALCALSETHRRVLVLRDVEDLSTAETAEALGISEGATKVRLHRARRALRHLLESAPAH